MLWLQGTIATLPIIRRIVPRHGLRNVNARPLTAFPDAAELTNDQKNAMETLRLLHNADCTTQQVADIQAALHTLRPRAKW